MLNSDSNPWWKRPCQQSWPTGTRIKIIAQKDLIQEDSGIRGGELGEKETHQAHILMERASLQMQGKCLLSSAVNYFLNRRSPFPSFHSSTISIPFIPHGCRSLHSPHGAIWCSHSSKKFKKKV